MSKHPQGVIAAYREFLPVTDETPVVSLQEGHTPLIPAQRLGKTFDPPISVYFKCEGFNPTGSFKDRGMCLAISKALEKKARAVICASTGNTSASASAYGARAGLPVCVVIPEGEIAMGKLAQAMIHGAKVLQIKGNFDEALNIVKNIAAEQQLEIVNSINPFRIEGQKTAAFEVCDVLGAAPTFHFLPVGNAGNITAYWKGYWEYKDAERISTLPKMMGFQASGAAPIVLGHVVKNPETVASAIRIGNPQSWKAAQAVVRESLGTIDMVTDDEILHAYQMLPEQEGIYCEPASAASVAGLLKLAKTGIFQPNDTVVCTLTGHGLKDVDCAMTVASRPTTCVNVGDVGDAIKGWI